MNRRSVIASVSTGGGLATLQNFCCQMNLPSPVTSNAYQDHLKQILEASKEHCEELMKEAAERLRSDIVSDAPELVDEDADGALPCTVTVDGTWQKRGHTSKIGVIFVISVKTGEILDYRVKSLYCHECAVHEQSCKHTPDECNQWKSDHEQNCSINHEGNSGAMEAEAAKKMFLSSTEDRNLKYLTI